MGQFKDLYLRTLESRRPQEFARRANDSLLRREANQAERRAQSLHDTTLASLLKGNPEPADHPSREQQYRVLSQQAREVAIADLVDGILPEAESDPTSPVDAKVPITS